MHDMVVLLAAVPVHLFELAGGSIPSASCGWMPSRLDICNFLTGYGSLAGCNENSGRLLGFSCFLVTKEFLLNLLTGGRLASGLVSFRLRLFGFVVQEVPRRIVFLSCLEAA